MFPPYYEYVFAAFAFILGASIGSFLNVCIYRMPLGLSVNEPKRSFCPSCKYQIPFHHNIPLVTWLVLRGKCANCGSRISFRYFGVEFLTGLLFLAIWLKVWTWGRPGWPPDPWLLALPYWIMGALFIVATFIDFEHFIIPDEITLGGTVAGVVLSLAIPAMQDQQTNLASGFWSLVGAGVGYGTLWLVTRLGKMAFGKKRLTFDQAAPLSWIRHGEEADFTVGEEKMLWSEFFYRGNEQLHLQCTWIEIDGERFENAVVRCECDWLHIDGRKWELLKVDEIRGEVTEVTLPREAMGMGDVKFIACIGAFLGWKAVVFTIMGASSVGAVIGLLTIAIGRREWSAKIPFGPYLALGALIWLFTGPEWIQWYWRYALSTATP
ncbi:MAG: prepilin peptidase [Chthoniobacter sp.]|uniref:prepilin peptidase n=1 Tax=Chthoniobacter sp. TaxID=2510640 RepID=UPI0032A23D3C